ncbi:MAG: radical SAM protein [Deltaproteobacteria bacterium]|nr:radical SAM protein [Deltaproteobacteria bacterium]
MQGLLGSRYASMASNTIDYWMLPDDPAMTHARVARAVEEAPVLDDASLSIYVHVPFCAQRCRFCAFSGGNSLELSQARRYAGLVVRQLQQWMARSPAAGMPIGAVNIGGGSPDLLREWIGPVLEAIHGLPGFSSATELAVELTLNTATRQFVDALVDAQVTKLSFGVQSLDPAVRVAMRQPRRLTAMPRMLEWIDGRIPVVNADLITGLPGQDVARVVADLETLLDEPRIHAISSYLLTPRSAPALLAAVEGGAIPRPPGPTGQALMRLHTYTTLLRRGWQRRGTNTYADPTRIPTKVWSAMAGDECIAGGRYEAFVLGVGPQAVSMMPGARVENLVDIEAWCTAMEQGHDPWFLPRCSDEHQHDMALWCFPLRAEHLPRARLTAMRDRGALDSEQERTLAELVEQGLVIERPDRHELSMLGEVFMGHLVRDLKRQHARQAVDEERRQGDALGRALQRGLVPEGNLVNNRQRAAELLEETAAEQ